MDVHIEPQSEIPLAERHVALAVSYLYVGEELRFAELECCFQAEEVEDAVAGEREEHEEVEGAEEEGLGGLWEAGVEEGVVRVW